MSVEQQPPAGLAGRLRDWMKRYSIVVFIVVALGLVAAWFGFDARRTWSRLDRAAHRFKVPDGFRPVATVRQGTAFCFVTCTNGGEALVTIVLDGGEMPIDAACDRIRRAVSTVAPDVEAPSSDATPTGPTTTTTRSPTTLFQCVWSGSLGGQATAGGVVMLRSDLQPLGPAQLYGPRWTEKIEIPAGPLLAWIEFNSGLE
jgi:hypothetical protein